MADDADRAQEVIEISLQDAIDRHKKPFRESLSHCEDCGDEIPERRRAAGNITTCIECQSLIEIKRKRGI
jgi:phage/conjugal plasmid C-4 type zinc finger TraR family protein